MRGNLACPVRGGADGKGPEPRAPRRRPTPLGGPTCAEQPVEDLEALSMVAGCVGEAAAVVRRWRDAAVAVETDRGGAHVVGDVGVAVEHGVFHPDRRHLSEDAAPAGRLGHQPGRQRVGVQGVGDERGDLVLLGPAAGADASSDVHEDPFNSPEADGSCRVIGGAVSGRVGGARAGVDAEQQVVLDLAGAGVAAP